MTSLKNINIKKILNLKKTKTKKPSALIKSIRKAEETVVVSGDTVCVGAVRKQIWQRNECA